MVDGLTTIIQLASVAMAAWGLISTFRDQPMVVPHVVGMAVLWLLLIAQAVVSVVLMVGGERPIELATFVSYLVAIVLVPPGVVLWGLMERSRWGPAVIAFACLVIPVMLVRLEQIWLTVA